MGTPRSGKKAAKKTSGGSSRSAKAGLIFPVGRVGSMLRGGRYAKRVGAGAGVYLAAVLEYLTAELLELAVKSIAQSSKKTKRITPRHVSVAVRHDDELGTLLKDVTVSRGGVIPNVNKILEKKKKGSKKAGKKSGKKSKK